MRVIIANLIIFVFLSAGIIHPHLAAKLNSLEKGESLQVIVHMKNQPDLSTLSNDATKADKVRYLQEYASNNQLSLIDYLIELGARIDNLKTWWIFSGLTFRSTEDIIKKIATRPDVDYLIDDFTVQLQNKRTVESISISDIRTIEWNIEKVVAPECWNEGFNGANIIVGNISSGVDVSHPVFHNRWLAGGWYDAVNGQPQPYDDHGAGTYTMGIICGGDGNGPDENDIGVAPGAKFICAKAFNAYGVANLSWLHSCFQWFAGQNAKVVNNSWASIESYLLHFWNEVQNLRALGIYCVFDIGDGGPSSGTSGTPGNYPTTIGVGATLNNDDIWNRSSRGPAPDVPPWNDPQYWGRPDWNLTKPDISAPGINIRSALPGGGYSQVATFFKASAHVTGAVAICLQRKPNLDYIALYNLLLDNADIPSQGQPYPNNNYGWGRLNCYSALHAIVGDHQADNQVKSWWWTSYIGDDIYNTTGSSQYVLQFADPYQWAAFHIKIENDGTLTEKIRVKATEEGTGNWTTRYFDALTGGNDITSQIKSADGWLTGLLSPEGYKEIRVEVRPGSNMQGLMRRVWLTSCSSEVNAGIDVVYMDTQCNYLQPDNLIKNRNESVYTGNNIYNATGQGQTKSQKTWSWRKRIYDIKVENDGETWDVVVITGNGSDTQWTVKYYDALSGGQDITDGVVGGYYWEILNPGQATNLRLEVTPKSSAQMGSQKVVLVTSYAGYNYKKKDAVKAVTINTPWYAIIDGPGPDIPPEATGYNNSQRLLRDANNVLHLAFTSSGNVYHTFLQDTAWSEPVLVGTGKYPSLSLGVDNKLHSIYAYNEGSPDFLEELRVSTFDDHNWSPQVPLMHTYDSYFWGVGAPSFAVDDTTGYFIFETSYGPTYHPAPGNTMPMIITFRGYALIYGEFPLASPADGQWQVLDSVPLHPIPVPIDTTMYEDSVVAKLISPSITLDPEAVVHVLWEGFGDSLYYYRIEDTVITKQTSHGVMIDYPLITMREDQIDHFWCEQEVIKHRYAWTGTEALSETKTIAECESPFSSGPYLTWTKQDGMLSHLYYGEIPGSGMIEPIEIEYSTDLIAYPQILYNPEKNNEPASIDLVWTEYSYLDSLGYIYHLNLPIEEPAPTYAFDMGTETPVPVIVQRDGYLTLGPEDFQTFDYDSTELIYHMTLHSPHKKYKIRWTYYHEEPGKLKLQFNIDDILHHNRWVEPGKQVTEDKWIPQACLNDNEITIKVKRLKGTIAVLSGLEIEMHEVGGGGPQSAGVQPIKRFFFENMYPNPTKGILKIRFNSPDERKVTVKMYDVVGRLAETIFDGKAKIGMNEFLIMPKDLAAGVYFVRLETSGYEKTEKIILLQ